MRRLLVAVPLVIGGFAFTAPVVRSDTVVVFIGDSRGSLGPCGCTKPMAGGIRRMATRVRALTKARPNLVLAIGSHSAGDSTQERLKVETLSQTYSYLGASLVALPEEDAGRKQVKASLENLMSSQLISSGILRREKAGFVGVAGPGQIEKIRVWSRLAQEAKAPLIVMLDSDSAEARKIANILHPAIIQYRVDGRAAVQKVGQTWLITSGSKLRDVVALNLDSGKVVGKPQIYGLNETVPDDPTVSKFYARYLRRVERANLIAEVSRDTSAGLIGTSKCGSCHEDSLNVWHQSKHSRALATLEKEGHSRDPECVSCHVVGLDKQDGFSTRAATPELANVGCESCHGGGNAHAGNPRVVKAGKVGEASCAPCHNPEHSANFKFSTYWKQIMHR